MGRSRNATVRSGPLLSTYSTGSPISRATIHGQTGFMSSFMREYYPQPGEWGKSNLRCNFRTLSQCDKYSDGSASGDSPIVDPTAQLPDAGLKPRRELARRNPFGDGVARHTKLLIHDYDPQGVGKNVQGCHCPSLSGGPFQPAVKPLQRPAN